MAPCGIEPTPINVPTPVPMPTPIPQPITSNFIKFTIA